MQMLHTAENSSKGFAAQQQGHSQLTDTTTSSAIASLLLIVVLLLFPTLILAATLLAPAWVKENRQYGNFSSPGGCIVASFRGTTLLSPKLKPLATLSHVPW